MLGRPPRDAQSYDHLASHYEALTAHHPNLIGDWLAAHDEITGDRALDAGCGGGRHAVLLADRFASVLAVDASAPMIEHASSTRPHERVTYEAADMFDVEGSFDLVFSVAMLHHVDDLDAALRHLRSLVAPGGRAVLADVIGRTSRLYKLGVRVAPRAMYRTGAVLELLWSLVRRKPHAIDHFRVSIHAPWLDHLATDRFLTYPEFEARYGAVFDGAEFLRLQHLGVCVWRAP